VTLDEKILAYLDGSASPTEMIELEGVLEVDRSARDRFARLCEQDGALRQILQVPAPRAKTRRGLLRPGTGPAVPWTAIVLAAAALLFALVLWAALSSDPEPRTPKFARPRPLPVEVPDPAPKIEPPPPPPPVAPAPKKVEPKVDFVVPKPEPTPEPKPEPPPKPEPAPPPPPAPKVTEAVVIVAQLEKPKGQVLAGKDSTPAADGFSLPAGAGVQTVGPESAVQIRMETTIIELGGDTRIAQITNGAGKKLVLDLGTVTAQVSKQPAGQPLVFLTPHAEARVLGTKLTLAVSAAETRLEVREGRVRLTRLSDNSSTEVTAGQFAVASDALKPQARKIPAPSRALLVDEFDDESRWTRLEGGFPTVVKGAVEIDLSPRPGEPYAGGGWHLSGGVRTKQSFSAPFRVSVDVDISHKHSSLNTLVVFTPKAPGPRAGKNEIAVRLREGEYSAIVETLHAAKADASGAAPIRERWTVEFGLKEVAFFVNGRKAFSHAHGLALAQEYFVELQGAAKMDVPQGARVRFDNVKIEP
jgi:hypothetical protein